MRGLQTSLFKLLLTTSVIVSVSGGLLQDAMNLVASSYGLKHIEIANELEQGFENTLRIIINPNRETTHYANGHPILSCESGDWIYYNSSSTGNRYLFEDPLLK